jgi:hypothetical protein
MNMMTLQSNRTITTVEGVVVDLHGLRGRAVWEGISQYFKQAWNYYELLISCVCIVTHAHLSFIGFPMVNNICFADLFEFACGAYNNFTIEPFCRYFGEG